MVFAYDFPHWKSHDGLLNMVLHGIKPDLVIAAPFKILAGIQESSVRIPTKGLNFAKVEDICNSFNIPYRAVEHNSDEAVTLLRNMKPTFGVILGARILSNAVIQSFSKGIMNCHPGLLPWNRGLDNIKWAVHDHVPQAVTFHLIDHRVDVGQLVSRFLCDVYPDDSWQDIYIRLMNIQTQKLSEVLISLQNDDLKLEPLTTGKYNKQMNHEQESQVQELFDAYKRDYQQIAQQWKTLIS